VIVLILSCVLSGEVDVEALDRVSADMDRIRREIEDMRKPGWYERELESKKKASIPKPASLPPEPPFPFELPALPPLSRSVGKPRRAPEETPPVVASARLPQNPPLLRAIDRLQPIEVVLLPDLPPEKPKRTAKKKAVFQVVGGIPPTHDEEFERLRPHLVEYDLPQAYSHHGTAHSPAYNISLDRGEPYGNANREFPWRRPLGLDHCPDAFTRTFRYFPPGRSIILWRRSVPLDSSLQWVFPVGTVFCEVFYQRHEGVDYPWLMLTKTKDSDEDWVPAAFAPVISSEELPPTDRTSRIRMVNHHPVRTVDSTKHVATLPEMSAEQVKALLSQPFRRVDYFDNESFMPYSAQEFSLVAGGWTGAGVDLDVESCMQCHRTAGKHADEMDARRDWYGHVRGSDGIFSWHPYTADSISYSGFDHPVRFRPELSGLLRY
jgi:hypothetical protein